jgi:hypothetical protein
MEASVIAMWPNPRILDELGELASLILAFFSHWQWIPMDWWRGTVDVVCACGANLGEAVGTCWASCVLLGDSFGLFLLIFS